MSTCTPTPIRRAIVDDQLLDAARTRRQLTDTALSATGGEAVSDLREDEVDRELWHAVVHFAGGDRIAVRMDRRLGTVVVHEAPTGAFRVA
jgi:sorbitol-specific phosphotransferase system component IIBC